MGHRGDSSALFVRSAPRRSPYPSLRANHFPGLRLLIVEGFALCGLDGRNHSPALLSYDFPWAQPIRGAFLDWLVTALAAAIAFASP